MLLFKLSTVVGGHGVKWRVKGSGFGVCSTDTHLHMDLDREWNALLQLFGFLIEVLDELPDGDSFLEGKNKKNEKNKLRRRQRGKHEKT